MCDWIDCDRLVWKKQTRHKSAGGTSDRAYVTTAWTLWWVWTLIGIQSFGGGASTQLLIWHEFVEKRKWLDASEIAHFWNLCQLAPGINIIALAILIGRKLSGPRGIVASVLGLLVPSAGLTCLLAAGFEVVQQSPVTQAVLRGVVPATAGVMALVAFQYARPILTLARKEGVRSVCFSTAVMACTALALIAVRASVVLVLVAAAVLGIIVYTPWHRSTNEADVDPRPTGTAV